jgi:hypothetical protein
MLDRPVQQERKRARKAKAQSAWRQRQRDGEGIAPVRYGEQRIAVLIRRGWLDPALADDRRAIGEAIDRMLEDSERRFG